MGKRTPKLTGAMRRELMTLDAIAREEFDIRRKLEQLEHETDPTKLHTSMQDIKAQNWNARHNLAGSRDRAEEDNFKIDIIRKPFITITMTEGNIEIQTVDDLLDQDKFITAFTRGTGRILDRVEDDEWDNTVIRVMKGVR